MVGERKWEALTPSSLFQCVCNIHSPEPQMCLGEQAFLITIVFCKG